MFLEFKHMGLLKGERSQRIVRWVKTIFVLVSMLISLLLVSAPILVAIADALLPSALLSASLSPATLSMTNLSFHFNNYDFRYSLIDIPLISIVRSLIIFCVYSLCDGPRLSRGPYLSIATMCSVSSLVFVSMKASYVFSNQMKQSNYVRSMEVALIVCSLSLAVGHVIVAYRISCRERRKLLVFKIDIEAVSACKNGFPIRYQKLLKEERLN